MEVDYPIRTERLGLRRWNDGDTAPFAEMNADPDVMEFFPRTLGTAESAAFVQRINGHFAAHGFGLFAVDVLGTGAFAGFIGLSIATFPAPFTPCIEVGWRLRRSCWGAGYATEGAAACLSYGFEHFEFSEIVSFTAAVNLRSIRVMEKIGLRRIGEFLNPRIEPTHRLAAHVLYSAPRADYPPRR